jgi:hypothetical protein
MLEVSCATLLHDPLPTCPRLPIGQTPATIGYGLQCEKGSHWRRVSPSAPIGALAAGVADISYSYSFVLLFMTLVSANFYCFRQTILNNCSQLL